MKIADPLQDHSHVRHCLTVGGKVQGVGFRPFVYHIATELGLAGGVRNTARGVVIEIEGPEHTLNQFLCRLNGELPPHATIQTLEQQTLPTRGKRQPFQIWSSEETEESPGVEILPDLATCSDCLQDILSTGNRRYQYPFSNCTHCGPRFSIIRGLPYDRQRTTMAAFDLCPNCRGEYTNPGDRRFHAQPNACSCCGPRLEFWGAQGCQEENPIGAAAAHLHTGKIIALKGLGGFQLLVDARNFAAVARLRWRKGRPDKPLALMYPNLEQISDDCRVSPAAARVLSSAQDPIVLLPKRSEESSLASNIAPNMNHLGVMLPTTPLHHLLFQQCPFPIVATSGNLSGEPIYTDEQAARQQLATVADGFLIHNRPIQRPVDDAVVQLVQDQPQLLRHARGYAPQVLPLSSPVAPDTCILALGAHLKNTIALSLGNQIVLSQHIGDLDTRQARKRLRQTVADFLSLYHCQPTALACDLHPDYSSTYLGQTLASLWDIPLIPVQHHYAHVLAAMAEHQLQAPVLGITWDGTGYGLD
ncbi:MAG: carbamoyltransferase HypF, partial [Cyanobacteria bacterium P01_F01_bin.116]